MPIDHRLQQDVARYFDQTIHNFMSVQRPPFAMSKVMLQVLYCLIVLGDKQALEDLWQQSHLTSL